jgi:hypothetical protein
MPWYQASALVAAICVAFAIVHSLLVTDGAKGIARKLLGEGLVRAYYRLAYTVVSVITTALAVYLIVLVPDRTLLVPPLWMKVIFHLMQLAGLAVGAAAFRRVRMGEFAGLTQAGRALRGETQTGDDEGLRQEFMTGGIYGVVRHPMYLAGILMVTFNPYITQNWLTVSVMADIYFVVGAILEERRLLVRFGEEYRLYARRVPRLLPRVLKRPGAV